MVLLSLVAVGASASLRRRSLISQEPGPDAQPVPAAEPAQPVQAAEPDAQPVQAAEEAQPVQAAEPDAQPVKEMTKEEMRAQHEQEKQLAHEKRVEAHKALHAQEKAERSAKEKKAADDAKHEAQRIQKAGEEERNRILRAPAKEVFDRVWFKKPWVPLPDMPWA